MVVIRSGAETKNRGGLSQFFCIGSIPTTPANNEETPTVATSDTFFWRSVGDVTKPTLLKAPTWTIGNLNICNPDEGERATVDMLHLIPGIQDVDQPDSLKTARGLEFRKQNGQILPFTDGRLLYSFKTFGKTEQCPEPMTAFPPSDVSLALRFLNHLDPHATRLSFSNVVELEVDKNDNVDTICNAIIKGFKTATHDNTKALLKAPLRDRFDMQLWVLPQIPDGRTLFRYSGDTALYTFLNKPDVKKGNLSLFMEVHLVHKD